MAHGAAGAAGPPVNQIKRPGHEHATTPNQQVVHRAWETLCKPTPAEKEVDKKRKPRALTWDQPKLYSENAFGHVLTRI